MNKTGAQLEIKPENTTVSMILIHNIKQQVSKFSGP